MTLHVSFISGATVVQLGDRLLTLDGEAWDATTNKTVVVEATNGRAVIGFAGAAHVGSEPTGEWLLRKITGSATPHRSMQFGGNAPFHLGDVRRRITAGLDIDFPRGQRGRRAQPLELLVSGWAYPRIIQDSKRPSSFTYSLRHSGKPRERAKTGPVTRFRYRDPSVHWALSDIGRSNLVDLAKISSQLQARGGPIFGVDDTEDVIVGAIREASALPGSLVGSDIMSVSLSMHPDFNPPHFRYYRDTTHADERIGYTPALVGRNIILPSTTMTTSAGLSIRFNEGTDRAWGYSVETVPDWEPTSRNSFRSAPGRPWV
jgi:hypothetical protein